MRPALMVAALLGLGASGTACRAPGGADAARADSARLAERVARLDRALASPDSGRSGAPIARWTLPGSLAEISGLALTPDARLLAHNDESARVFEIDYRRGIIVKRFRLGDKGVHADFEGITVAGDKVYMLSSDGRIFEFLEGPPDGSVEYTVHDTKLGKECEFEGVAFDPSINSLLMACKNVGTPKLKDFLVIYRWKLADSGDSRISELTVPMNQVIGTNDWKEFKPSDITVDPSSGNYVLVSAQQKALVELTPAGAVVSVRPLPDGHDMAEGLAITKDGILILSDESVRGPAAITLYKRP